jgi:hypothetical protein
MSEQNKAGTRRLIDVVWNRRASEQAMSCSRQRLSSNESDVPLPGTGPAVVKKGIRAVYAASGQHHNR